MYGICDDCLTHSHLTQFLGGRVCKACLSVRERELAEWLDEQSEVA